MGFVTPFNHCAVLIIARTVVPQVTKNDTIQYFVYCLPKLFALLCVNKTEGIEQKFKYLFVSKQLVFKILKDPHNTQ